MEIPEIGVSRRTFLKVVIWLLATCQNFIALVSAIAKTKNPPLHIYFGESGIHRNAIIGALFSENAEEHKDHANQLRKQYKYYSRLLYRSTDKFKIPFATGLILYLVKPKQNRLYFCATQRGPQTFSQQTQMSPNELINNYYLLHQNLIMDNSSGKTPKIVNLQIRNRKGPDKILEAFLKERIPNLLAVNHLKLQKHKRDHEGWNHLNSQNDDLLQFSGFLTGCVHGDQQGDTEKVKVKMTNELKKALGVTTLNKQTLQNKKNPVWIM